jgi:Ca2+-binding RTX toxin-like protein
VVRTTLGRLIAPGPALVAGATLLAGSIAVLAFDATAEQPVEQCLERTSVDVLPPTPSVPFVRETFPDGHTFDAREQTNQLYPVFEYPIDLGAVRGGRDACFVGGTFIGQQPRDLTWEAVKAIGGAAIRLRQDGGAVVDGLQVDNLHDGINLRSADPSDGTSGDGWVLRNSYMTYMRDDCIENDDLSSGTVRDVLFDGCFVGISADDVHDVAPDQSHERITLNHALIKLQLMPSVEYGMDHGDLLKWSPEAPRVTIRNSVFFIEDNAAGDWPEGTILENVTLVLGQAAGAPSLDPMPGLRITRDRQIWTAARQDWLDRHGCSGFGNCPNITTPIPPREPMPRCEKRSATSWGTASRDTLKGTPGPDVILGFAGKDRIFGKGAKDVICAGNGNDVVVGNIGSDRLLGQVGSDLLRGGGGFDVCIGGAGRDRANGCRATLNVP